MKPYIRLSRPKQWVKNVLVFSVPVLSFNEWSDNGYAFLSLFVVFTGMIAASTAVYAFNDAFDWESDVNHPVKKLRPIASGTVSVKAGYVFSTLTAVAGLLLTLYASGLTGFVVLLSYLMLNVLYSVRLKNVPYVEMLIVAYGYPVRVILGALAVSSAVTVLYVALVVFLAAALVFAKRLGQKLSTHSMRRNVVDEYSQKFLTRGVSVSLYSAWVLLIYWIIDKTLTIDSGDILLVSLTSTLSVASSLPPLLYISKAASEGELEHPESIVTHPVVLGSTIVFVVSFLFILDWAL